MCESDEVDGCSGCVTVVGVLSPLDVWSTRLIVWSAMLQSVV